MSLMTQAYLLETYGLRLGLDDLAAVLGKRSVRFDRRVRPAFTTENQKCKRFRLAPTALPK